MNEQILLVDDEQNILEAYERVLRGKIKVETACGAKAALEKLSQKGAYAVVVSDMYMPDMDGVTFLSRVREQYPETVRMMLTGKADIQLAMEAMHRGNIFRFLTKPCPPDLLLEALQSALQQYRLIASEKELLQKTLSGSVRVLTEILAMVDPQLFGRSITVRQIVKELSTMLKLSDPWKVELACLLSHIGFVSIPPDVAVKYQRGHALTPAESKMIERVPKVSKELIAHIPRLETIAEAVYYHDKRYDGSGFPYNEVMGEKIPLDARIAKIALDLSELKEKGLSSYDAIVKLRSRVGWYDPKILDAAFLTFVAPDDLAENVYQTATRVKVDDLKPGQILMSDIVTKEGTVMLVKGGRLTIGAVEKIKNISILRGIKEPILVAIDYDQAA